MIDPHEAILTFLGEVGTPLHGMVEDRIFTGRSTPPEGYELTDGPCICFRVRGGGTDEEDALLIPSVQFKCYGHSEERAYEVYRALFDRLQNGHDGTILHAQSEILGQPLEEADTEWSFVLTYFSVMIRSS